MVRDPYRALTEAVKRVRVATGVGAASTLAAVWGAASQVRFQRMVRWIAHGTAWYVPRHSAIMTVHSCDEESLLAEADELVRDRAIRCDRCRRGMRFFPSREGMAVRAFGRSHSWRCTDCVVGSRLVVSYLSGVGIVPADWLALCQGLAADVTAHFDELRRAHARQPRAVLAEALDRLCMQLQSLGEAIADHADAADLDNVIELSRHRAERSQTARHEPGPPSVHATP